MWLSGQQKRPVDQGEGQTGIVTMSGGETAVLLDSERRGLHIYSPAGYRWTPKVGQRVLVIQGRGETPCVVGARQDEDVPDKVEIRAQSLNLDGETVCAGEPGGQTRLMGQVYINSETLEDFIIRVVFGVGGGAG